MLFRDQLGEEKSEGKTVMDASVELGIRTYREVGMITQIEEAEERREERGEKGDDPHMWPEPFREDFEKNPFLWPPLSPRKRCLNWIRRNKKILIRTITWNLCANTPPSLEEVRCTH